MKITKCDRCGKIFEKNKPIKQEYNYTIKRGIVDIISSAAVGVDLCDDCRENLLIWLGVKAPQSIYDIYQR